VLISFVLYVAETANFKMAVSHKTANNSCAVSNVLYGNGQTFSYEKHSWLVEYLVKQNILGLYVLLSLVVLSYKDIIIDNSLFDMRVRGRVHGTGL